MRLNKYSTIVLLYMLFGISASAQTDLWPNPVDALVEYEQHTFEVTGSNSGKHIVTGMLHVFNKKGQKYSEVYVPEDKLNKCKYINIRLLDMDNNELRKLKKSEIETYPITNNITLYDDSQFKIAMLTRSTYPYKVQYSYEVELKSLINWPGWKPERKIPVLNSSYRLRLSYPIEYRSWSKSSLKPDSTVSGNVKEYTWRLTNLAPTNDDIPYLAPEDKVKHHLRFASKYFQTNEFRGSNESWDSLAEWFRRLLVGRDHLPIIVHNELKKLITPEDSKRDIVQKIYKYLQDETRYVAIHLGIGGWQPHTVASVYQNKYGDCKDLSMFAISMLKSFDIPAYPALILTRDKGLTNPEFPANNFNHLIAFVPLQEDTLWLECTSDNLAAGQLNYNIEGCNTLVVKDDSGKIITTPETPANANLKQSQISGTLTSNGSLQYSGTLSAFNNVAYIYRYLFSRADDTERLELVQYTTGKNLPKVNIAKYTIENLDSNFQAPVNISFSANASNVASVNGSRIFLNPNLVSRKDKRSRLKEKERNKSIFIDYAYRNVDSIAITLPLNYSLEAAPKAMELETIYSLYKTSWVIKENTLHYKRLIEIKRRQIPAEAYEEHRKFMKQVRRNDNSQFVFKKGL